MFVPNVKRDAHFSYQCLYNHHPAVVLNNGWSLNQPVYIDRCSVLAAKPACAQPLLMYQVFRVCHHIYLLVLTIHN